MENHLPDVLETLANLSSDEVFTPPEIANNVLDMLPQEIFKNKDAKFLDPCCKSGVFLREIAKRLDKGLENVILDKQERIDHIMKNQIYGIGITALTSFLTRRSLYGACYADTPYSLSEFDTPEGNVIYHNLDHTWNSKGKCEICGANKDSFSEDYLDNHAYEFIHRNPEEIFNMKFDVIIGNPPYQLNLGNEAGNSSKSKAIYHLFVDNAIKMNPKYICMIMPSRWMTKTTEGISDEWVDKIINCNHIKIMHDYLNASDIFPGVQIEGGVCYFLIDTEYNGKCKYYLINKDNSISLNEDLLNSKKAGIVIRDHNAQDIIDKINLKHKNYILNDDMNFYGIVSPKDFFTNKVQLTSSWDGYSKNKNEKNHIKLYVNKQIHKIEYGFVSEDDIPKNLNTKNLHKVYIPAGHGSMDTVLGNPFYGEPNSVCSQTYLVIGYNKEKHNLSKEECENIIKYIKTRFFRYLVSVKKKTQNGPRMVYQFVPMQDFTEKSDIDWSKDIEDIENQLYKKYGINEKEIDFINSMIRPMGGENDK